LRRISLQGSHPSLLSTQQAMRLFLLVVLYIFINAAYTAPIKPTWPLQFDCNFTLNVPTTPGVNNAIVNAKSHFYYNYDQVQASLIDYPELCLPGLFKNSEKTPCKIIFTPVGTFYSSALFKTCLWFPGVGTVPPDFLAGFTYATDSVAIELDGTPHYTHFWVGGDDNVFQYWTDTTTGADIQLLDGGSTLWTFAPLNVVPQNPSLFVVPKNAPACNFTVNSDSVKTHIPLISFARFAAKHSAYTASHKLDVI